jgi:DNA invertase Pin-like site-specific DNA recombinase
VLSAACRLPGALLVYSLSRLARSTRDAIDIADQLHRVGADLVSLTERIDTAAAACKMLFRLLAVLAEFERSVVSERTSAALAHKRSKGERVGTIPCGWRLPLARSLRCAAARFRGSQARSVRHT